MLYQQLFHLLGIWLLLSQLPRELLAKRLRPVKKLCGREFLQAKNEICSKIQLETYGNRGRRPVKTLVTAAPFPPLIEKEEKTTDEFSEFTPDIGESVMEYEEFPEMNPMTQSEVDDSSPSEPNIFSLNPYSRKKRKKIKSVQKKCCRKGCTVKHLLKLC
ncbi:prorelaxin-like [Elephas maximus indicus]|uniref:prorelaxin-like n=1 Tax=Elephas maximus indicus TaxID=99487 RepID=UPI0021170652|nr:prorelaxin-like [Elephas maximus indicus]